VSKSSVTEATENGAWKNALTLIVGAIGVVYGDIGTSPLYAFREAFHGHNAVEVNTENILGVLSIIFWMITFVVTIKYLTFVMRADNEGEGGILALLAILGLRSKPGKKQTFFLIALGLFGSALLYGDGVITPAISVLSAVEGLEIAMPQFHHFVVPITIAILIPLFFIQKHGTGKMGMLFGPVMVFWFFVLFVAGIASIAQTPVVLLSINPVYAYQFLMERGSSVLPALSMVFLVITGTEALYSDMGHFGVKPIRKGWFYAVLPSLVMNYLGQGALLLRNPEAAANPFYYMFPDWSLIPVVILASMATIIASQALISASFSLTHQAVQLGYLPRFTIEHTSEEMAGQIYIPEINTFLMVACVTLVLIFQESGNLADAYGMAVICTMMITSLLFYFVAREHFKWGKIRSGFLLIFFLAIEIPFFAANLMKLFHGAWIPLMIASFIYLIMIAWKTGRKKLYDDYHSKIVSMTDFLADLHKLKPFRIKGSAVYMTSNIRGVPLLLLHNLTHNKVLHEQVILLSVITEEIPRVKESERYFIKKLRHGFYRIIAHYGYMEDPNIPKLIDSLPYEADMMKIDIHSITFFLGRESLILKKRGGFLYFKLHLFTLLSRNMLDATRYFKLPPDRVVEIGRQVIL
jgi:KUP system potassium uptake protein